MGTRVKTGRVRASYANVFVPRAQDDGPAKYSMSILIDKTDKATLKALEDAIEKETQALEEKLKTKRSSRWNNPLRDGDVDRSDKPEYAGKMFVNTSSRRKPGVIDAATGVYLDTAEEFDSGDYCKVVVSVFGFDTNGNKGAAIGLENILKLETGERLTGGSSAMEDFADDLV